MATIKTESVLSGNCPDRSDGKLLASWGHYTYADEGAVAVDDVIQMCWVPKGARIIDILAEWSTHWDGASTIDIGDGADDDRFLAAIAMATASRISLCGGWIAAGTAIDEAINASGLGYTYTAADTIDATIEGAAAAAGDILTVCVLYTVEGGFDDE